MNTQWILHSHGEVLGTVQKFLRDLWLNVGLEGMLVPQHLPGALEAKPLFTDDPAHLDRADPFAPLLAASTARLVVQLVREHPLSRLGVVLRPCELRALTEMAKRDSFHLDHILIIGVDCLGTFPAEDYAWHAEMRGAQQLTRETLQFARQGGILLYRNRLACQMCASPIPLGTDLNIHVLGLPTRQTILITTCDGEMAQRLRLDQITDGVASPTLIAQHDQMRLTLIERRSRARERITHALPAGLPKDVNEWVMYLANCAPCQACLTACPIYRGELSPRGERGARFVSHDAVRRWLAACAGCGLCEDACPKHLPLTAAISRIRSDVIRDWILL